MNLSKKNKIINAVISKIRQRPYLSSFFFGCLYFTVVINWMFTIRTSEIAEGVFVKIVAVSAAIIMISTFALGFVIFSLLNRLLGIKISKRSSIYMIPFTWIVSEFIRSILFSIISLGPSGKVGTFWAYGNVGYFLSLTPLTYLGRVGGVYLLSFIFVMLVVLIIRLYLYKTFFEFFFITFLLFITAFFFQAIYSIPTGKIVNATAISYSSTSYPEIQSNNIIKSLPKNKTDILILPEYSGYRSSQYNSDINNKIIEKLVEPKGIVIDSKKQNGGKFDRNSLTFTNSSGEVINQQDKWFTIPSGEYIPYIYQIILAYAGQEQLLLDYSNQKTIIPGDKPEYPVQHNSVVFGSLVCSGVTSPTQYRQLSEKGATILTNSASLGTLGVSSLFHIQTRIMAKQYAVDNARPFIQSAKDAPAYIFDHNGKSLGIITNSYISKDLYTNKKITPYTRFGDWVVYLGVVAIFTYFAIVIFINKPKEKKHEKRKKEK